MNQILIDYIQKQLLSGLGKERLTPEDDLLGSGLIDSMGMMSLVAFVESRFELKVPPQDMIIENFMTVEAISDYLGKRKAAK